MLPFRSFPLAAHGSHDGCTAALRVVWREEENGQESRQYQQKVDRVGVNMRQTATRKLIRRATGAVDNQGDSMRRK